MKLKVSKKISLLVLFGLASLIPVQTVQACACGCNIFDIGTGGFYPMGLGGRVAFEWDFMDQNHNWSGTSTALADNNTDKEITTNFFRLNGDYMFTRSWGIGVEVPFWHRNFSTLNDNGTTIDRFTHASLGDIKLTGMFTGFSTDMSTGIAFGVKIPTGDWKYPNFDRDVEIGTGSTDFLLGVYHFGHFFKFPKWIWSADIHYDQPIFSQDNYTPGAEVDVQVGINYRGINLGNLTIIPLIQVAASQRWHDSGDNAAPDGSSGYTRFIAVPGLELDYNSWRLVSTFGIPIYQYVNGNQLVAPLLCKVQASFIF